MLRSFFFWCRKGSRLVADQGALVLRKRPDPAQNTAAIVIVLLCGFW